MTLATIYLIGAIVFLGGSIGIGFLAPKSPYKMKCANSQCYKFTDKELKDFQDANNRVQQTLATPKIIPISTEEIINTGANLLNKEGFHIPQLDDHT